MKYSKGFTIIELLLAIAIGSMVLLGATMAYRTLVTYTQRVGLRTRQNRQVTTFFSQLYADVATAYIPQEPKKEKLEAAKNTDEKTSKAAPEQKTKTQAFVPMEKAFFITTDSKAPSITKPLGDAGEQKSYKPCNMLSLICTNPLALQPVSSIRPVRVIYELKPDPTQRSRPQQPFMLVRKETKELANATGKTEELLIQKQRAFVRQDVVARNVKSWCCLSIAHEKKMEKDSKHQPSIDVKKLVTRETWGDQKPYQDCTPCYLHIVLELYEDAEGSTSTIHQTAIPIATYSALLQAPEQPITTTLDTAKSAPGQSASDKVTGPTTPSVTTAARQQNPISGLAAVQGG